MKIRQCFVANSSSSSFVCEICGESEVGYDGLPEGFVSCVNDHTFCDEHKLSPTNVVDESGNPICIDDCDNCELPNCVSDSSRQYDVPEALCPICQFITYSEPDMAEYLFIKFKVPKEEVFVMVKETNKRRKKLYDNEYISEVLKRNNLTDEDMISEIKDKFKTYADYTKFLYKR